MFAVGWGANQFSALLVGYRQQRGVSAATADALFGVYAVALVVALLLGGPAADRWGRARIARPALVCSLLASLALVAGDHSVPWLLVGRTLAGVASGSLFAAGTAWVKELSSAPHEPAAAPGAGARRAALALSAGFGVGPLVAGLVAQWSPHPLAVAYVPHLLLALAAAPGLWRAPETVPRGHGPSLLARLRVRGAGDPRFVVGVVPAAVWVFAAPSVTLAVLPPLVTARLHGLELAYAGLVALLTLGTGVLVQPLARTLDDRRHGLAALVALALVVAGCLLGAAAAAGHQPVLALLDALPLGAGYGIGIVAGLLQTQRLAPPDQLGGLTAVYYAVTYVGFGLPLLLVALHPLGSPAVLLCGVAAAVALCAVPVARASAGGRLTRA